jgi:hypothetical protein
VSRVFEAKYPGWCICCEGRIHAGDNVHYQDDTIVHDGCQIIPDRDPLAPSKTEPYCPSCFTYHAGECE